MKALTLVAIATVVILGAAGRAHAYPQFEMSKDNSCSGCHLSPTGGGPLSENGLLVSEQISKFGTAPEFMYGKVPLPDWLVVQGDFRGAYGYLQAPQRYLIGFPMQAELYGVATMANFSFHVTAGARPAEDGNEAATRFWSREHYLMWQQNAGAADGLFVRAGRFMPAFGLRFAEHPIYTRRYGGSPLYADTYALGASYITDKIEAHATGFVKDPLIDPVQLSNGAALYAEYNVNPVFAVGAGGMFQISDFDHKFRGTVTAKHYLAAPEILLQAEVQVVNPHVGDYGYNQLVGYLMGTIFLPQGVMADLGLGHFDENIRIKGLDRDCLDLQIHWFYGIPATDLLSRLSKGRFRVKGNIDRATAETYVRDLARLGARCTIEEAQPAQRLTPTPFPAIQPGPQATARPSAPAPQPSSVPPAPSMPRTTTSNQYQSGLAAAFSGETSAASLGALEGDNVSFALSSVDGADDKTADEAAFAPPGAGLSASIGPAPEKAKPEKKTKPKDEPVDMFAPPDAQEAALLVDIADDEKAFSARKRTSTPPPMAVVAAAESAQPPTRASTPAMRKSAPSIQPATQPVATAKASSDKPLANPNVRFVAGVVLALVLGFIPAHFVGRMREESAYEAIDRKVIAAQQMADTPDSYALLDKLRADQLARKYSAQRNAAIVAILVWAAVAGGVAFVWFKKIDWERFEA